MRTAFIETLSRIAQRNPKVMLLTGDLGFSVFEPFIQSFPCQYINCGIAEQTMTGLAAGLASEGYIPFVYSIVPFVTMRNFEQIRNDLCYQNFHVVLVGVGAGFSYGTYGHSHHGLEDVGILRTLPNMTILCPGDPREVAWATRAAYHHSGPVYLRLGKAGERTVHTKTQRFSLGKGVEVCPGSDATIFVSSILLPTAVDTATLLRDYHNISVRVVSMHTIKPFDTDAVKQAASQTRVVFTLEEHSKIGGLGSAVCEVIAEHATSAPCIRLGVADAFTREVGMQTYMRDIHDLSPQKIAARIQSVVAQAKKT